MIFNIYGKGNDTNSNNNYGKIQTAIYLQ